MVIGTTLSSPDIIANDMNCKGYFLASSKLALASVPAAFIVAVILSIVRGMLFGPLR
jgi:hypothetical protein